MVHQKLSQIEIIGLVEERIEELKTNLSKLPKGSFRASQVKSFIDVIEVNEKLLRFARAGLPIHFVPLAEPREPVLFIEAAEA